ncbi:MAG: prepilin-type N-terminal cleavage/methylation domain-containing protein [Candidatus Hydrogenedentes bacterium]|nr:prepilin-type N-terminal cleavage/methylation domain-containing protein [Candidatus Hydrogenedentota bacterium]MBI3118910.1 prepilin-type N-terminal cleavage/methylation domain-containing protein [Candidatus Hydrogenedentota bacterium]
MVRAMNLGGKRGGGKRRRGFTLVELLVALSVISIAGWVFVSFYSSALDLNRTAVNRATATQIAQDQLLSIVQSPKQYQWALPEQGGADLFSIRKGADDPPSGNPAELPAAMPVDRNALSQQTNYHERFRWLAFGRLPSPEATYYEVTVVVHWEERSRQESVALTGSVPRFALGGTA